MNQLSHTDKDGSARMVDITDKPDQVRTAISEGFIRLLPETIALIVNNQMKKGSVLTVAEIAGVQAAKKTSELIPLCHPLLLSKIEVNCSITHNGVRVKATVVTAGKTGVEMEALTAVSVALLTIYDMCKAVDKQMEIAEISLKEKTRKNPGNKD
ncbi:MAG TPA: cyclic pyranopterin monophosphate synthase MoaC [Bacteroidales bacterium]|nr:cyclic pyranopterin monophosphate synthase MoaC [Bacteroidales bacterium]